MLIAGPNKIGLYDVRRDLVKNLASTNITEYNSVIIEGDYLDFSAKTSLNRDGDLSNGGGLLVSTSSSGIIRYQLSQT